MMRLLAIIALLALTACGSGHYQGGFGQGLSQGYAATRAYPVVPYYQQPLRCRTYPVGYSYRTTCH